MSGEKTDMELGLATLFFQQLLSIFNKKTRDYSNSFHNFDESTVIITKNLGSQIIKKRNTDEEKIYYCTDWIARVSAIYGVTTPSFEFRPDEENGGSNGFYSPKKNLICLQKKISLVTLLHEFRHCMQHQGHKMIDPDIEEDARAWSMSLFKVAMPKAHATALRKGLVKYK